MPPGIIKLEIKLKYQKGCCLKRIPRTLRRTIITMVALLLLFIISGVAYVLISDRENAKSAPATVPPAEVLPLPKPTPPGINAPEGAAVETLTSPVSAGSNSSITIATNAGSACTISVSYNNVPSTDSGLAPKTADVYGNVNWTWTVDSSAPVGTWPVKVTCVYHGRSGVVIGNLEVAK